MNDLTNARLIDVDGPLRAVLRHVYVIQPVEQAAAVEQQLVPNYEMLLIFNFGPDVAFRLGDHAYQMGRTAVLGPLKQLLRYEVPPGADLLVAVFTLNGFYRFAGEQTHRLRTRAWPRSGAWPNEPDVQDAWEQMIRMPQVADRIEFLKAYARLRLAPTDADTQSVIEGVSLFSNLAVDPVKAIAQTRHLTTRSVQTRLQTNLGFSAKELARFLRFKRVVTRLLAQHPQPPDWADLVLTGGYHDQSHLIKDFRQFLGMTPTAFVRQLADGAVCITQPGAYY